MGALLRRIWTDPAYFVGFLRACLMLFAELFRADVIPTGVPGGGAKIAGLLMIAAVAIPAGDANPRPEGGAESGATERKSVTPSGASVGG